MTPVVEMRFVFFALLDGALVLIQVAISAVALHLLFDQVAVGHGVADGRYPETHLAQNERYPAGGLAFPRTGAHGADRDDRLDRLICVVFVPINLKSAAGGQHHRSLVHDVFVGHIAVSEDHLIDLQVLDQTDQFTFRIDRDTLRVKLSGQFGGVLAAIDIGYLGGGEGFDFIIRITAIKTLKL